MLNILGITLSLPWTATEQQGLSMLLLPQSSQWLNDASVVVSLGACWSGDLGQWTGLYF